MRDFLISFTAATVIFSTGGALAMPWQTVAPKGKEYCAKDSRGEYISYSVTRQNGLGEDVQLTLDGLVQRGLCGVVNYAK